MKYFLKYDQKLQEKVLRLGAYHRIWQDRPKSTLMLKYKLNNIKKFPSEKSPRQKQFFTGPGKMSCQAS